MSVAFHVAARYPDASIWINDAYPPLVAFWRVVQDKHGAAELFARISAIKASSDESALRRANLAARKVLQSGAINDLDLALAIYLTNRTAFSALIGTYSPTSAIRWLNQSDDRLLTCWRLMQGWSVTCYDFAVLMNSPWSGRDPFQFLDPPYEVKEARLYGFNGSLHQGFDHAAFHAAVHATPIPTMVTYNAEFEGEYASYPTCHLYDHGYTMQSNPDYRSKQGMKRELLVANYGERTISKLMAAE